MLGMLVLAIADLRTLLTTADIAAAMSVEGLLGTDRVFAADLHALRPQPGPGRRRRRTCARCSPDSPIVASHRGPEDTRVQDAYSLRCAPAGRGRRARHGRARRASSPSASSRPRSTTRSSRPTAASSPTATSTARRSRYVLDFLAIVAADVASIAERRTDRFLDAARSHGLPPFLADDPGVDSGLHDRPVHAGRARLRAQAARRPRVRRLDPELRDAGGPRLDGLVGRAQAAPRGRRPHPRARDRAADRRARDRAARAASTPAPATARGGRGAARRASPAPARTASSPRRSRPRSGSWRPAAIRAAAERVTGPLR